MTQDHIWVLLIFISFHSKAIGSSISISSSLCHSNGLLNANRAWFLDQAVLQCLLRPKQVQKISYDNLGILFLVETRDFSFVPSGTLFTLEKCTVLVPCEMHTVPRYVPPYLLRHPCTISGASCSYFSCAVIHGFKYLQNSFLKDGLCIAFFHSPSCFGMVSETRRGKCQVYSAMLDLEILSRSNFFITSRPTVTLGLWKPYRVCLPSYMLYTC